MKSVTTFVIILLCVTASFSETPKRNLRARKGLEATPHSAPYTALITTYGTVNFRCAGTLISSNFVLTSADFVVNNEATSADVVLGAHHTSSGTKIKSTEFKVHENFQDSSDYNLAVLRLSSPVRFSPTIQPVYLPRDVNEDFDGLLATITGWGTQEVLNFLQLTVLPNEECEAYFKINERHICAFRENSTAFGDGGSPLVSKNVLIGVGSYHSSVIGQEAPSVFTRVTSFLEWLQENTDVLVC